MKFDLQQLPDGQKIKLAILTYDILTFLAVILSVKFSLYFSASLLTMVSSIVKIIKQACKFSSWL